MFDGPETGREVVVVVGAGATVRGGADGLATPACRLADLHVLPPEENISVHNSLHTQQTKGERLTL